MYWKSFLITLLVVQSAAGGRRNSWTTHDESDAYPEDFILDEKRSYQEITAKNVSRVVNTADPNIQQVDCPVSFDKRCSCTWEKGMLWPNTTIIDHFVVNCSNAGIRNASFLEDLPQQTAKVIFTGNNVAVLEANLFGKRPYPNLAYIDMSNNQIKEIKGKAFHHVSTVTVLRLNDNQISNESIHDHSRVFSNFVNLRALFLSNAFNDEIWCLSDLGGIFEDSNLTKLQKLHLESNEIQMISDPKLFCDLKSLRELYLRHNQLPDLNIDVDCLPNLSYIDLSFNHIRTIKPSYPLYGLLNKINAKDEELRLDLSHNPFDCDCEFQSFIDWFKNTTKKYPDRIHSRELYCKSGLPESNIGLKVEEVHSTLCQVLQISNLSQVTTALVWILSVAIIALIFALFYFQCKAVTIRGVQPLLQTAVHGVKYTSIDKQEEQAEIAHV